MQDLDVIARNNAKAAEAHAPWNNEPPGRRTALHNPITNA